MAATDIFARRATFCRALRLLSEFRYEQPDPARFYGGVAADTAAMISSFWLGSEMLRVTRPGGLAVLSYTVWLGPFGGHEMGLTHYLGGARAAARYARKHGHRAKNDYGSSLFAVSAADGLEWAASTGALVAA